MTLIESIPAEATVIYLIVSFIWTFVVFNYFEGKRNFRAGTGLVVFLFFYFVSPLTILYGIYLGLRKIAIDISIDLKSSQTRGFDRADIKDYEKAVEKLINEDIAVHLLSDNKDIRARAKYLSESKK